MKNESQRILYLDLLRIISIMAVLMIHLEDSMIYSLPLGSLEWDISALVFSACRWAVPIFFMISGALFLRKDSEHSLKEIYSHNIFHLITAFIFWSLIYTLVETPESLYFFAQKWIRGPFHFWFIFSMISIYILIPILRSIANSKALDYYLLLGGIFTIFLPTCLENIGILLSDFYQNPVFNSLYTDYHKLEMYPVLGYSFYFILGYKLSVTEFRKSTSFAIKILLPIGLILTWLFSKYTSLQNGQVDERFFDYFTFNVFLQSIGIFESFRAMPLKKVSSECRKIIATISHSTFGVFLIHILIKEFIRIRLPFDGIPMFFKPFIYWPIVYFISLIISILLNKVTILRKTIV
ncbi:MAG: acyltransferase family protein [Lachnospiraceae bacterium]|nr:acyltransferase family protein [Lachnospiraceae bacterium]